MFSGPEARLECGRVKQYIRGMIAIIVLSLKRIFITPGLSA